jgi:hypothetical protein
VHSSRIAWPHCLHAPTAVRRPKATPMRQLLSLNLGAAHSLAFMCIAVPPAMIEKFTQACAHACVPVRARARSFVRSLVIVCVYLVLCCVHACIRPSTNLCKNHCITSTSFPSAVATRFAFSSSFLVPYYLACQNSFAKNVEPIIYPASRTERFYYFDSPADAI